MATLGSPTRGRKSVAKRVERCCCSCLIVFPLTFVYGLTTWAAWVQAMIGFEQRKGAWAGYSSAIVGVLFWILLNWSYTTAVFTDAGSPLTTRKDYSALPSAERPSVPSLTVKSTGEPRFCKKCQSPKPDRAHHCSTCKRCVLKMDHHCPWLATCVGFRNYKPFLLFLIYVCLFCWVCFIESASWFWAMLLTGTDFEEGYMPVNYILLAVISGVIGLVLSGFTGWHIYLAMTGQTTIESLEKTRWTTNVKKSMQRHFDDPERHSVNPAEDASLANIGSRLAEIHANALPGVLRPEEGTEEDASATPAQEALRRNYELAERRRERDRYASYLEEQDSERLPHAFDHGWRNNLTHVFGPFALFWFVPICNTTGDGWNWEPTTKWMQARDDMARERQARMREENALEEPNGNWVNQGAAVNPRAGFVPPRFSGPSQRAAFPPPAVVADQEDYSSDEEADDRQRLVKPSPPPDRQQQDAATSNWNDIPEGFMDNNRRNIAGARSPRPPRYQRRV